ncbi:unnamed protein product, partial [Ilex paraguariensis]
WLHVTVAQLITLAILLLSPTSSSSTANPTTTTVMTKPRCDEYCGDVRIPYPFGLTQDCSLNGYFLITCDYSFNPPKAFYGKGGINVTEISIEQGQMQILNNIGYQCYDQQNNYFPWLTLGEFTVSSTANEFTAVGCDTSAIVTGFKDDQRYTAGCISICEQKDSIVGDSCSGAGCCQTSIPVGLRSLNVTLGRYSNNQNITKFSPCNFAFMVKKGEFNFSLSSFEELRTRAKKFPLVLDWTVGDQTCEVAKKNSSTYACIAENSECIPSVKGTSGYRCNCSDGYEGNPYLPDGCQGTYVIFNFWPLQARVYEPI